MTCRPIHFQAKMPTFVLGLVGAFLSSASAAEKTVQPYSSDLTVELHAHVFMHHAMSWAMTGNFDSPIRAADWQSRFGSQANAETLWNSGNGIVVVTLYAHPLFAWSMRDAVRKQIDEAEAFVKRDSRWVIARDAREARDALKVGKRVLILSLEGAGGVIENDADIQEFVVKRGIRIVTPLHLMDDHFGGVAFLKGIMALSSPFALLRYPFVPNKDELGVRLNSHGLTEDGEGLIRKLVQHGVWIDLAHSSDLSQKQTVPLMVDAGQPLLYTHTVLRHYHGAERGISDAQLHAVAQSDGYLGILPSETMLAGTRVAKELCPPGCTEIQCGKSLHAMAQQFREIASVMKDPSRIAIGSDHNGGINHLAPSCNTRTEIDQTGLVHIGNTAGVWQGLRNLGVHLPKPLSHSVDKFLEAWARVVPEASARVAKGQ